MEKEKYNSFNLVMFIWKWKTPILIICLLTAVLSFVFSTSYFIRPRFKSTAVVYAPRTNSIAKILLNEQNYNERLDIKAYAIDDETEQMMQILKSRPIQDSIIQRFSLYEYYDIDPNEKYAKDKMYKAVNGSIMVERTRYGAISISVTDWDPQQASDIANEIVRLMDIVKNNVERDRAAAAYEVLKTQLIEIEKEVAIVNDSIRFIMSQGVMDVPYQAERLTQQLAIAVAQGNTAAKQRLEAELAKITEWGGKLTAYQEFMENFNKYHALCKQKMMDAKVDMESNVPSKFVIEDAIPADKKNYPKKLIIMITSTVAVFFLSIFALLVYENIRRYKTNERRDPEEGNQIDE